MKKILLLSLIVALFAAIGTVAKARDVGKSHPKIETKSNIICDQFELSTPVICNMSSEASVEFDDIGARCPVYETTEEAPGCQFRTLFDIKDSHGKYPDSDERLCGQITSNHNKTPPRKEFRPIRPAKRE
jgi:hypothetical protein